MKNSKLALATVLLAALMTSSCKKENNNPSTTPAPTPTTTNYTKGTLTNVTILTIPNPSTYYDTNGADIYWSFWANADSGAAQISGGQSSAVMNVQSSQFPLIKDVSYPVLFPSGTINGQTFNGNYFIKLFDEDIISDGQSSDQFIGEISFTWNDLISNGGIIGNTYKGHVTKTVNGTSIQIGYSLE